MFASIFGQNILWDNKPYYYGCCWCCGKEAVATNRVDLSNAANGQNLLSQVKSDRLCGAMVVTRHSIQRQAANAETFWLLFRCTEPRSGASADMLTAK